MTAPVDDNPLATAALVVGILSLCGGVLGPVGLGLGLVALRRANARGGAGQNQARAGIVFSLVGLTVTGPLLLVAMLFPALTGL